MISIILGIMVDIEKLQFLNFSLYNFSLKNGKRKKKIEFDYLKTQKGLFVSVDSDSRRSINFSNIRSYN